MSSQCSVALIFSEYLNVGHLASMDFRSFSYNKSVVSHLGLVCRKKFVEKDLYKRFVSFKFFYKLEFVEKLKLET